ncbi:hypothetical protein LGQ02_07520 [Bacillus shivajii]|uniref:SA1362 family protein n=1 Tax=Bacillus shivajii TaxID=1983719 RepID=UPI001CF9B731|nr:SA1362 family protein [Bacillus shivajii]UCZ54592.1 hypothetical protein LGQ02_07520 [Bacillus shivajii]
MFRYSYHPIVLTVLILAVLGLGYLLFTEPGAFIMRVLMMIGVAAVIYFLFKTFIMPKMMNNQAPYAQQQRTYSTKGAQPTRTPASFQKKKKDKKNRISRPLVKKQSDVKLTVIEGKKNKKKNRALF